MRTAQVRRSRRGLAAAGLAAFILATAAGCERAGPAPTRSQAAAYVSAQQVATENLQETIRLVGDIRAADSVVLYSKVSGRLIEYRVREGERVQREQVVALVDRDEVGFSFQEAPVLAPISGTVGRTHLDRGENVETDTPIALIVNLENVRVTADVIERDLPKVSVGQRALVRVDAYPEEVFEGVVDQVSPVIDLQTRSAPVEIVIDNHDRRLLPGMFSSVQLIVDEFEGVVIPEQAIALNQGRTTVYVMEDEIAHRREVALGLRLPGRVHVVEGLEPGEMVITAGHQRVTDGAEVRIAEDAATTE